MLERWVYWLVTRAFPRTAEQIWCAGFAKGLDIASHELGVDLELHIAEPSQETKSIYSLWGGNA